MTEKLDTEILFPEIEVKGYKIKPWVFGELVDLSPILSKIVKAIHAEGIKSLDCLVERMIELIPLMLPFAPEIIAKTLHIEEQEIRTWPIDKATVILLTIINQNLGYLKNCFGLVKSVANTSPEPEEDN